MTKAEKFMKYTEDVSIEIMNIGDAISIATSLTEYHDHEEMENGAFYILKMMSKRLEEISEELTIEALEARDYG